MERAAEASCLPLQGSPGWPLAQDLLGEAVVLMQALINQQSTGELLVTAGSMTPPNMHQQKTLTWKKRTLGMKLVSLLEVWNLEIFPKAQVSSLDLPSKWYKLWQYLGLCLRSSRTLLLHMLSP